MIDVNNSDVLPLCFFDISTSSIKDISPFIMSIGEFRKNYAFNIHRSGMFDDLSIALNELYKGHILPVGLLVGGSFVCRGVESPHDLDCGLIYVMRDRNHSIERSTFLRDWYESISPNIDMRVIPADAGISTLISLFGGLLSLYSQSRIPSPAKGSLYVPLCNDWPI